MAQAKRDENSAVSVLGWDGTTTQPLLVDPSTGRLLVRIVGTTTGSPTVNTTTAFKRDENSIPVSGGVSSSDSSVLIPLHIDATTGNLTVTI